MLKSVREAGRLFVGEPRLGGVAGIAPSPSPLSRGEPTGRTASGEPTGRPSAIRRSPGPAVAKKDASDAAAEKRAEASAAPDMATQSREASESGRARCSDGGTATLSNNDESHGALLSADACGRCSSPQTCVRDRTQTKMEGKKVPF